MNLIIIGCEYAGKTTLGKRIEEWIESAMGKPLIGFHDHFTIPDIGHGDLTDEEYEQVRALSPKLKSMIQNHQIIYHLNSSFYYDRDNLLIGAHIENAIYGPLYYGYEDDGTPEQVARVVDGHIMEHARDTILVLLKASPEAIRARMKESPHPRGVLQDKDVEHVLARFDEESKQSLIRYTISIDTTNQTPDQTFQEFLEKVQPLMREGDQVRMLAHKALLGEG